MPREVWIRDEKGNPFVPGDEQEAFITSQVPFTCLLGGMGGGKTTAGCAKLVLHALCRPNSRWLVGRYSYKELYTTTWEMLKTLMPRACIQTLLESPQHMVMRLWNGATIWGWNLSNWKNLTSLQLSGAYVDEVTELPDPAPIIQLYGRLRYGDGPHFFWGTGTPNGMDWVYDMFWANADEEHQLFVVRTDQNPHLPARYYDRLYNVMSEEMRAQFLRAEFLTLKGQILHNWRDDFHFIPPFPIPPHWTKVRAIDPGYSTDPACCLFGAVDPEGNLFVYDECWFEKTLIRDQAREILSRDKGPFDWTQIDPQAARETEESGKSTIDLYREHGIEGLHSADNRINASIDVLLDLLAWDDSRIHPLTGQPGSPGVFVFDTCPNLRREVIGWRWGPRGKPVDKDDHAISALRYLVMGRPQPARAVIETATHPAYRAFFEHLANAESGRGREPVLGNEYVEAA